MLKGVAPQGAILFPLLFSLLVNDLPVATEGTGTVISQFTDDSGGWLTGSDGQTLQRKAQAGLDSIWCWSQEWGFKISKTKTVGIIFGNKNLKKMDVYLGGTKIHFEETVTFLGMLLDRKFTLLPHIKNLRAKCQRDLNLMRMLRGTDFGFDKNSLLLLYKSLIRPKIDYGAIVYDSASPSALKMLDGIQRKALIIALRALPSTPSVYLELEAGIEPLTLPLTLWRESQIVRYWVRISSKPCNPVNAIIGKGFFYKNKYKNPALPFGAKTANLVEEHLPNVNSVADSSSRFVAPWLLKAPQVDIILSSKFTKNDPPSQILAITGDHVNSRYAEHLKIFTDGSKNKNLAVSAAMVIPAFKVKISRRLSDRLSIYATELTAIKYALDWTLVNKPHKVAILSDSLLALQSLSLRNSNSRPDLLENILCIYDQCHLNNSEVTLVLCPAHVGLDGNEVADDAVEGPVGDKTPLATHEVYSILKTSVKEKWSKGLAEKLKGKPFYGNGVSFRPPHKYSTNKRVDKCVTRLRLGYNLLPGSLGHHIIGGSAICPTCGVRNSTEHFLLDCGVHLVARQKLSGAISREDVDFNIQNVLYPSKALRTSTFKALETFLLDCQMTDKI